MLQHFVASFFGLSADELIGTGDDTLPMPEKAKMGGRIFETETLPNIPREDEDGVKDAKR